MKRLAGLIAAMVVSLVLVACQSSDSTFITGSIGSGTGLSGPDIPPSQVRFAIEPFTGAPGNTADDISRRIGEIAERENIALVRRNTPDVTHRVAGYLSVTGDDSRGVLFYVLDIFDRDGTRVYRLTGQESIGASGGDPWTGVDSDSINNVAERIVRSLDAWLNRTPAT